MSEIETLYGKRNERTARDELGGCERKIKRGR